ncbi:hypothetical protein Pmani_000767, partial [Petrolisthes manimaculis]
MKEVRDERRPGRGGGGMGLEKRTDEKKKGKMKEGRKDER